MPIRPITPSDDDALGALVRQCLAAANLDQPGTAYFDPELDHLSRFYAQAPDRAYFVYTDARDQVLGGVGVAEYERARGIAELQKLYLLPQARGHHAGRRLLAYCEQQARALGWQKMYLETHTNLSVAIHLYETSGYQRLQAPLHRGPHTVMDHYYLKAL